MRLAKLGSNNHMFGISLKKSSQECLEISKRMKGKNHPLYGKRWKIDKSTNKAVFL